MPRYQAALANKGNAREALFPLFGAFLLRAVSRALLPLDFDLAVLDVRDAEERQAVGAVNHDSLVLARIPDNRVADFRAAASGERVEDVFRVVDFHVSGVRFEERF